ncbi:MAG: amino acid adenylation domain-containing protein [bacterium]
MTASTDQILEVQRRMAELPPERREALRLVLERRGLDLSRDVILPRESAGEAAPLAYGQEQIWFLDRLNPGSSTYNMPALIDLLGELDVSVLERSLQRVVDRHEILRTTFGLKDGRPVQFVAPELEVLVPHIDLRGLPDGRRDETVRQLTEAEALRPFDLARGPLIRATLVQSEEEEYTLVLTLHHIVADGWSNGVLVRELTSLYAALREAREPELPTLGIQFADFATWQRRWLQGPILDELVAYWSETLADPPPAMPLPTDYPRRERERFRGTYQSTVLPVELGERLQSLSRSRDTTLFMVLLAALNALLYRYTGAKDLLVGTSVANRQHAGTEPLIGFFVNTLVMRTRFQADPRFHELLDRVREVSLGAFAHQDLPFEVLVKELQPERDLAQISPLVQTVFVHLNLPAREVALDELRMKPRPPVTSTTKFDVVLTTSTAGGRIHARLEYNSDLFEDATITRLMGHLRNLLEGAADEPHRKLSDLPLLDEADRRTVLEEWSGASVEAPALELVHERILKWARDRPEATAVVHEGHRLTYRELVEEAAGLARHLAALGVGPDIRVGLCFDRSAEMIVGLLGILLSGGAYVALDPAVPEQRLRFQVGDAGAEIVVTSQDLAERLSGLGVRLVHPGSYGEGEDGEPSPSVGGRSLPENLAYVIYTSGSTGWPRPVGVEHRALASYVGAILDRLDVRPGARFATLTTVAADLGNTMIFAALCTGGELHVVPEEKLTRPGALAHDFSRARLHYLKIVPSHLAALLESPEADGLLPTEALLLGGEATGVSWAKELERHAAGCRILNHYGPTETTIGVTTWEGEPSGLSPELTTLPLGEPLAGSRVYLLGCHLELQPSGAWGQLAVGGSNLSRGYLGRPASTAAKFVPDPFGGRGGRLYLTGDVVKRQRDGTLEFARRGDDQIKIRGFRVEPREVEAALEEIDGIQQAVVRPFGSGLDTRLAAYFVPDRRRAPELVRALRRERLVGDRPTHELPNSLSVVHQNKNETEYLYEEIFERRAYFKNGVDLEDGAVVFDVGANIGMFMLYVQARWRDVRIYSFEPIPAIHDLLRTNAALHDVRGAQLNCGLSDAPGTTTFSFYPKFTIMSGLHADVQEEKEYVRSYMVNQQQVEDLEQMTPLIEESDRLLDDRLGIESIEVELRTLSDVIEDLGVERIDLLKINVEKNEHQVLAGLRDEHWARVRQVVAEVHDIDGRNEQLSELLVRRGFDVNVEQDPLLAGTDLYYLYARREEVPEIEGAVARNGRGRSTLPGGAAPASLDEQQVEFWETVFDDIYAGSVEIPDPGFDLTGWVSRETGEPFTPEEMSEWLDGTVSRILELEPRRVLELGCGTGLILHRVAPHCEDYLATDFSRAAVAAVERARSARGEVLSSVRVERRPAHELDDLDLGSFDCVVLNSVVQYFPGLAYLEEVLETLVERLGNENGGKIFLGDLPSLPLLQASHAWSELTKAPEGARRDEVKRAVDRRSDGEEELFVDPSYFVALRRRLERIAGVDVLLKGGRHANELNRFRYDVVLKVGPVRSESPPSVLHPWIGKEGAFDELRELLDRERPPALLVEGIPNRRLRRALRAAEWLRDGLPPGTVGEFRAELEREPLRGVDPDALGELVSGLPYRVKAGWSLQGSGRFDALFVSRDAPAAGGEPELPITREPRGRRLWTSFANDPLRERLNRALVPELQRKLRERLPDYMVPADFLVLGQIPLTTNGKLDFRALPEPGPPRRNDEEEAAPETAPSSDDRDVELERAIARIWSEVLGRDGVGVNDNFFDLGGHSLLVVEVSTRLMESGLCSEELSVVDFFQYPTVGTLARFLRGGAEEDDEAAVVEKTAQRADRRRAALQRRREAAARREAT